MNRLEEIPGRIGFVEDFLNSQRGDFSQGDGVSIPRGDDYLGIGINLQNSFGQIDAHQFGHTLIGYHHVELTRGFAIGGKCCGRIGETVDLVAELFQNIFSHLDQGRFVIDEQNILANASWDGVGH